MSLLYQKRRYFVNWPQVGSRIHPAALVLASFLAAIGAGTALLLLPASVRGTALSITDALFTATSAVCVTGLVVVDTGTYFSRFGQWVILLLIQIGGLGVMTISVALFRWVGRNIAFRQRMILQDLFAHTPREDIYLLMRNIFVFTLGAEAVGAVLLFLHWSSEMPASAAAFTAIFHSVSAFCNAGFALYAGSMIGYAERIFLNAVICLLIVAGGIGFPVLHDLYCRVVNSREKRCRLSMQTKTVLLTTLALILGGAVIIAALEQEALKGYPSWAGRILVPLFQSITCRTAGFNTVDIAGLREATAALMIFLMFVGASPGSCGGGVKITTLALLSAFTFSRLFHRRRVCLFRKSIPNETVNRSISLILLSFGFIGFTFFMLLVGGKDGGSFLAYLFETVSAFGTVGLSMGITPYLGTWGKGWIIFMMIVGRVGVLAFAYMLAGTGRTNGVEYSEENIMIG